MQSQKMNGSQTKSSFLVQISLAASINISILRSANIMFDYYIEIVYNSSPPQNVLNGRKNYNTDFAFRVFLLYIDSRVANKICNIKYEQFYNTGYELNLILEDFDMQRA